MLDVLLPLLAANQALVPECIQALLKCTDVPFRLIVIVDGGVRSDFVEMESFLAGYTGQWKLLHNPTPVYLNQSIREGLEECHAKITAVIAPQVRLNDEKWFGKVQQIFQRDPSAFIVDTFPDTKSSTLYPIKRAHIRPAADGCRFAVLKTSFAKSKPPYGGIDPIAHWSRAAISLGGASWYAAGVRYYLTECQEHPTWQGHSAAPNQSA